MLSGLYSFSLQLGLAVAVSVMAVVSLGEAPASDSPALMWPEPTVSARPWTRWWWHGSAVDQANLTRLLEEYQSVGLGGVEITCIYGVQGNDANNRTYLTEPWFEAIQYAIKEAKRLGMEVDLPAGSGWRMGGPMMTPEHANSRVVIESAEVSAGEVFAKEFGRDTPQAVVAENAEGDRKVLTDLIAENAVRWQPESGDWTVYTLAYRWSGDRVKRPGPGGAGLNINPYSKRSVQFFLDYFGKVLDRLPGLRAQFHDSFEYEGDWQPEFLEEFAKRRGYRLEDHLPEFAGSGPEELVARIRSDYRETLSDLVLDSLVKPWVEWSHQHGQLARNQSHGSPANWLDLYAACDIPETESFGRLFGGDADQLILKFAASAANVVGHKLVASETGTWLDEHFTVTLGQLREIVDRQMLAGVNHVLYHGTAYSPQDAKWPGWLFYASSQVNPQNSIWRDLPALNQYITRCQSILQESTSDNDILLYWPLHDAWHSAKGMRFNVRVHNASQWFNDHPLGDAAYWLDEQGYAFDYVSDRGLAVSKPDGEGGIHAPGQTYKVVVIPKAKFMPLATLARLRDLAEQGATVVFWGALPTSPPGLAGVEPSEQWNQTVASLNDLAGSGRVIIDDLASGVRKSGVRNEQQIKQAGLGFLRKRWDNVTCYLLKNPTKDAIDQWISPATDGGSATIMNPMTGSIGLAETKTTDSGKLSVRVKLAPGETQFVCITPNATESPTWDYQEPAGESVTLDGQWKVEFVHGGPELPAGFTSTGPKPWTEAPDDEATRFAGTVRYSTSFTVPAQSKRWKLNLGAVHNSARVLLNEQPVATLLGPPYETVIEPRTDGENRLEVEVTGVAANRIRDLDRRGVEWRIFEDINLVNIDYKKFDASEWPIKPLGLHGPVMITPLEPAANSEAQ